MTNILVIIDPKKAVPLKAHTRVLRVLMGIFP